MSAPLRVVVVGAGVSGLAIAFEIAERAERFERPVELLCLDAASRAGGHIQSERRNGFLCEWGPTGFLDNAPATLTLVRRLALEQDMLPANEGAGHRFLYRRGALRALPNSPGAFLRSRILSWPGKLRVACEGFVPRGPALEDESVHDFATRRIGAEAAETLIDAMVSGIWAGDTRQLSVKATFPKMVEMERVHGGLFRAMLAKRGAGRGAEQTAGGPFGPGGTLTSFRSGMQALTDALAAALGRRLRLNTRIEAISDMGRRGFRVHLQEGAPIETDAVVLAAPAFASARMVRAMDPQLVTALEAIPYTSLAVIHLGFARETLDACPQGFGFLAPRNQGLRSLGSLWPSDIFEGRAPSGLRLTSTMIGGAHDEDVVDLDDNALFAIVREELHRAMGFVVAPRFKLLIRHAKAIPQYTLGHLDRVAAVDEAIRKRPGLFVGGNGLRGLSVNLCIEEAGPQAEQVLASLLELADCRVAQDV
jgi:oxygen-dependent protoporphyrinogen oxidase